MNGNSQPESIPDWQLPSSSDLPSTDRSQLSECPIVEPADTPVIETQPSDSDNPELEVRRVPLAQIVPNPHQPRRHFDDDALLELAESIAQHGVVQPILLRQIAEARFELIAGERRFRAAQLVGLPVIPALIQNITDREQAELSLIENLQREDLSPVETARAFKSLMNEFKMTQQEIGERVGKSQRMISNFLRLLQLPDEMLDSLDRDEIQEGHARALLNVENAEQRKRLWQQVVAERLSVRETERRVRAEKGEKETIPSEKAAQSAVVPSGNRLPSSSESSVAKANRPVMAERYEQSLGERLAEQCTTEVMIRHNEREAGIIEIAFDNYVDLVRIMHSLLAASS